MRTRYFRFLAIIVGILFVLPISAQNSRQYIRNSIREWGECRNVAITKRNGDVALYGRSGYSAGSCPADLINALKTLNSQNEYIDDVQLTDAGRWLVLYGNNGAQWNNIPYSLEREIREYNNNGESITSVTFNDDGDWILISTEHVSSSDPDLQDWLAQGMNTFGTLWTACITDDCLVAVFENGYKFLGNVPSDLRQALNNTSLNVFRLKIAGTAWFFADFSGGYQYNM